MREAALPKDEAGRLEALEGYDILDTLTDDDLFDNIALIAAQICRTPIALISFFDKERQWFKSCHGLDVKETPRSIAFCSHAILNPGEVLEVPDALEDERFEGNPLVIAEPGIRFYAGAPLVDSGGHALGTLCVIDNEPGDLSEGQQEALKALSRQVVALLERRQTIALLNRREDELSLISNRLILATKAGGIGIWDYDIVENLLVWDEQMYKLYGISPESFSGAYEAWEGGLHPDDRERERENLQKSIRGEQVFDSEFRVVWPSDGSVHFIKANATVLSDESGAAVRMIGTNWDITTERRTEEQLLEAKRRAEAATRAKSDFLAHMSHEIRNPMNGILGLLELVLATELNREQRQYLGLISRSADALLNIINDILDFSKIEAGKLELDYGEFELRDAIGDILKALCFRACEKGLELACQVQPDVPDRIVGDLGRIQQILVNLVSNALKFTTEGEVIVDVRLESLTGTQALLHFVVRDTGIGIAAEKLELIFKAFSQAEKSTARVHGGTGLGLAISSQLVELMNGRLWVESELGAGSSFHLTLPFGLGSDASGSTSCAVPEMPEGLRVLVVDDNDTYRGILGELFSNWEMAPTLVAGGAGALEKLHSESAAGTPFELVVLDAIMPEMDGEETVRQISSQFGDDAPPILFLSSICHRCGDLADLGVVEELAKPVKPSELRDAIFRILCPETPTAEPGPAIEGRLEEIPSMRVLLAEDSRINQMIVIKLLENRGHSVAHVDNGEQVAGALEKEDFDAILMDVEMPEINGIEATKAIRDQEKISGGHVPIIAMTANAMQSDRARCLAAGMDDYLAKPVRPADLYAVLEKFEPRNLSSPPPGAGGLPAFDPVAFRETMGADDLMIRVIELFGEDADRLLAQAREAIDRSDAESLHEAAHSLKGLVGNYSATPAFEASAKLDDCARVGDLECGGELLTRLEHEIERLKRALGEYRKTLLT